MKTKQIQAFRFVRFVLSAFCLLTLLVPLPSYGSDTGTVKGKIIDKADGEGIYGASVTVAGSTIGTATDLNGNFSLQNVPAKQQKVSISIVGYTPASQVVSVTTGQTTVVNLQLGQTTIMASEVVVGASLYKQDRLDVPVTANVVSQERIRQQPNPTLDQVIEDVPGVLVNRAGGQTTSTVSIRGSNTYQGGAIGTRVQGFYDGFPLNTPETGEVVWSSVNMNAADKVEILKGAAATLYGSGAMGGVMNAFGRLPEKFEVKAGVNGGFYDAPPSSDKGTYRVGNTPWFRNSYVGMGNRSAPWNYNVLYTKSNDDGYKENSKTELNDVKLKARYDINAKQYLQLSSFYNESTGGYAYTWPYDYNVLTATFTPHPEYPFDEVTVNTTSPGGITNTPKTVYIDDAIKRKNALSGLNYVNLLNDNLSLDSRIYYTYNFTRIDYNSSASDQKYATGVTRTPGEFNETNSNRYGSGVKFDWRAANQHRLLFGLDGNITFMQSTQYTADVPVKNALTSIQEKNAAAFVQDEWKLGNELTAFLSLRYDWSGINKDAVSYVDYVNPTGYTITTATYTFGTTKTGIPISNPSVDALNPRIALNYKAAEDLSFRASWGRSFRAPTLAERFVRDAGILKGIPNPALDKETQTAYELGMFKVLSEKVSFDIAGYVNNYDNLIESITSSGTPVNVVAPFPPFATYTFTPSYFKYVNLTKARIWGIETSLNYKPTSEWALNASYSYMNAKNLNYVKGVNTMLDNNPDPEWLPMRPDHTASASATWKAASKLSLNLNGRYVSKYKAVNYYTNPAGTNYPGNFIVFNTGLKYQVAETASLSLLCRNIGNVQYEEAEWFRAPGRSYVAGVDFTF